MKLASVVVGCSGVAAFAAQEESKATPVQKVLDLMEGMMEKGKAEKHAEAVQFSTYKSFCESTTSHKQAAIKEANEEIQLLKADIEKATSDAEHLGHELAGLDEDIAVWNGDIKAANSVRNIEEADFDALHKDYSESVQALELAINVLKKQAYDRPQAASLAQVSNLQQLSLIPPSAKKAIDAFLQERVDLDVDARKPGEAHGYEFRSAAIIDTLERLLDEFIAERTDLEKKEADSVHAFEMLTQDLTHQISEATKERSTKAELKAKRLQAKADAEGDLTDTTTTRDADQKYLDDLVATCEQKATDFESRQHLRKDELEAISKAIAIISGDSVAGSADKHLPTLLQVGHVKASALIQSAVLNKDQERVAAYLRQRAHDLGSRVLASLALRVGSDPFGKVKKMIKDLIVRLMEEAAQETEHKGWCDVELSTNEQTRKEKTTRVETLHAEIDELGASIQTLSEAISELTQGVAELDTAMAEATKVRQAESATNAETITDAKGAQTAVAQALTVLREFYAKAGEATALMQRQQPEAPAIFDAPYKGQQAEGSGVVSMLEVIQSDFGRLEADTKNSEATAAEEYRVFMEDSKIDKEGKSRDIAHKTAKRQDEHKTLQIKQADLEGTQKEMTAAFAYYDKLKPDCVDAGVSYDDRVSRRKEEIESLQMALRILNGEEMA